MTNQGQPGIILTDEAKPLPPTVPFLRFYGKAFCESNSGQIKWSGESRTALQAQIRKHPTWKGFIYIRSETRELNEKVTTIFHYQEVKP